jgi:sporulation protein YlmC with PRC-barrel domain
MSSLVTAELIGRAAYDRSGRYLGRVADLVVDDRDGSWRVTEVVVTKPPWGRLLGYERAEETGPWLLVVLARRLLRRDTRRLPWREVTIGHDEPHARGSAPA